MSRALSAKIRSDSARRLPSAAAPVVARHARIGTVESAKVTQKRSDRIPAAVAAFLVSLLLPWSFKIGELALSPYRLVLLCMLIPCILSWVSGGAGRLRWFDFAILAYCIWCFICLIASQGIGSSVAPFGMILTETMGPFLLARCFVRNAENFRSVVSFLLCVAVVIIPFEIFEAVTGHNIALEGFAQVLPTILPADEGTRMGLRRAQTVFEHPILLGVFFSSCFSLVYLVLGSNKSTGFRLVTTLTVSVAAFLSLSSAPIAAMCLQILLLCWDAVTRKFSARWILFLGMFLFAILVIHLFSTQGILGVYITYLTFSAQSGFYRVAIWDYGSASVLSHPLFGTGLGEWTRAFWMTSSVDNFWLLNAIRWGLVGMAFLVLGIVGAIVAVSRVRTRDATLYRYKLAYILTILAFSFAGFTVHFWGAVYVFFLFILGSGSWLLETVEDAPIGRRLERAELRDAKSFLRTPTRTIK